MKSRDFCFWLQGYFELRNQEEPLYEGQLEIIKKHLNMVFIHEIDPSMPNPKLDEVHASLMRC
jgi:predicted ferric reductase